MQDVRQRDNAKKVTGRMFIVSVASIILQLAVAQFLCNLVILHTQNALFNVLFYVYAVLLLLRFMRNVVAGYAYTLTDNRLILERKLGDSTTSIVDISLDQIISVRPVCAAEKLFYKQVTVIDPHAAPGFRYKAAFLLSLFSARLARTAAGKGAEKVIGYAAVYNEDNRVRCCVFRPNEEMLGALEQALGERFGWDDRMARPQQETLFARALQRAFPALYPHVKPLVSPEETAWADEELKKRKAARSQNKENDTAVKEEKPRRRRSK